MDAGRKTFRNRPAYAPCERRGVMYVLSLGLITYLLSILISGGQISGDWFLNLDPTGHLVQGGRRWANASIPYREKMVPIFIICFYYCVVVMVITFSTRDWGNMREWASYYEAWRLMLGISIIFLGELIYFFVLGKDSQINSPLELSKIFQRQVFSNKYYFGLLIVFLAGLSYWLAELISVFFQKVKIFIRE